MENINANTQLLSQRFLNLIMRLLYNKQKMWKQYTRCQKQNKDNIQFYDEMTGKYVDHLLRLNDIAKVLTSADDAYQFVNNICNGILSDNIINNCWICGYKSDNNDIKPGESHAEILVADNVQYLNNKFKPTAKPIDQVHLQNLQCLDNFSLENQFIINQCINGYSDNYVVSDEMYDLIEKDIGSMDNTKYTKLILNIHRHVMMYKLSAVPAEIKPENTIKILYDLFIKHGLTITPETVDDFELTIEPEKFKTINECKAVFQYFEELMKMYSHIDLLNIDK